MASETASTVAASAAKNVRHPTRTSATAAGDGRGGTLAEKRVDVIHETPLMDEAAGFSAFIGDSTMQRRATE